MKQNYTKLLLSLILTLVTLYIYGHNFPTKKASNALINMDAKALTSHFNHQLNIVLLNREYNCSSTQAHFIFEKFFAENPIHRFEIVHQGLNNQSTFVIAKCETINMYYKVYTLLKKTNNAFKVFQFRIESENPTNKV